MYILESHRLQQAPRHQKDVNTTRHLSPCDTSPAVTVSPKYFFTNFGLLTLISICCQVLVYVHVYHSISSNIRCTYWICHLSTKPIPKK